MSKPTVVDVSAIKVAPFDPATLNGFHLLTGDAIKLLAQVEELVARLENLETELHGLHPTAPDDDHGYYLVRDLSGCAMWCAISAISSVARG